MTPGSDYRPGREIARGGMGAVLDARDQKLGRSVAMKVMLRREARDEERQRFLLEARVLGQLAHPNIVPVHDLGTDAQGRHFYTMKLVQGVTLHEVLGKLKAGDQETLAKFPLTALLTVFQKVCDAVAFAHSQGIIHRDLKPQNIMVGEFGEVLVMDWGLAKILPTSKAGAALTAPAPAFGTGPTGTLVMQPPTSAAPAPGPDEPTLASAREAATVVSTPDTAAGASGSIVPPLQFSGAETPSQPLLSGTQLTLEGTVMGTPNYMSPEQAGGHVAELDERSDVFSLGGVLYALLTLRPPVEGRDVEEVLTRVRHADITPPALAVRQQPPPHLPGGAVPEALAAVALKALAQNRTERYRSVAELGREIAAYQGGFATAAERAGAFTHLRLFIARHRAFSAAAALIALLTVFFVTRLARERDLAAANADLAQANERKAKVNELQAKANELKATASAESLRRENARSTTLLADASLAAGDLAGLVAALNRCPEDLRDQTWRYLRAKCDESLGEVRVPGFTEPTAVVALPRRPGSFVLLNANGEIAIVAAERSEVRVKFPTGQRGARGLCVAGDGSLLGLASADGRQFLTFDLAGQPRVRVPLPEQRGLDFDLSRDGRRLVALLLRENASSGQEVACQLFETPTGRALWSRPLVGSFSSALLSPDGQRVVLAGSGQQRTWQLLDAETGTKLASVPLYPMRQAFSPDGTRVAVGTITGELHLFDARTGAALQRVRAHGGRLGSIAWLPNDHLLTQGTDGGFNATRWVFRLWDARDLSPRGTFFGQGQGSGAPPWAASENGELLTAERPPRRWSFPLGREIATRVDAQSEQAWDGAFLTTNQIIARTSFTLTRYTVRPGAPFAVEPGLSLGGFHMVATHPATGQFIVGKRLGGNQAASPLRHFVLTDGKLEERPQIPASPVVAMAFNPAGERLAAVLRSGALRVTELASGRTVFERAGNFEHAAFGPDDSLFALERATREGGLPIHVLHHFDGTTGTVRASIPTDVAATSLAVSPRGDFVAYGAVDRRVYVLRPKDLSPAWVFRAHEADVGRLAFHPHRPLLATASADGAVKLWPTRDRSRPVATFLGLNGTPTVLAFNPTGDWLLVDGQERTTRVYDVAHVTESSPGRQP